LRSDFSALEVYARSHKSTDDDEEQVCFCHEGFSCECVSGEHMTHSVNHTMYDYGEEDYVAAYESEEGQHRRRRNGLALIILLIFATLSCLALIWLVGLIWNGKR